MTIEYRSIDGYIASRIHASLIRAGIKAELEMSVKGDENVHYLTIHDADMKKAKPILDSYKNLPSYGDQGSTHS